MSGGPHVAFGSQADPKPSETDVSHDLNNGHEPSRSVRSGPYSDLLASGQVD